MVSHALLFTQPTMCYQYVNILRLDNVTNNKNVTTLMIINANTIMVMASAKELIVHFHIDHFHLKKRRLTGLKKTSIIYLSYIELV